MKRIAPLIAAVAIAFALILWRTQPDTPAPADPAIPATKPLPDAGRPPPTEAKAPERAVKPFVLQSAATRKSPNALQGAVSGEVRSSADGAPIPNAELTFFGDGTAYSTLTGNDGRFRWSAPSPGRYTVVSLIAEGFEPFEPRLGESPLAVFARARQQVDGVTLYLDPRAATRSDEAETAPEQSGRISGRVLDPEGVGVPDAQVRAVSSNAASDEAPRTVTTDPEGRFEVTGVGSIRYLLTARAEGYAPAIGAASADDTIELALSLGAILSGSVRDETSGEPVTSFTVLIDGRGTRTTAVVDPDGEFRIDGLLARKTFVRIAANGYGLSDAQPVELLAGEESTVDFELNPSRRVFGTVRDEATGKPIEGAQIFSELQAPGEVPTLASVERSGSDGSFSIAGLGSGRRTLSVRHPDYNTRLISGLEIDGEHDFGPVEVEMRPVAEGEKPKTDLVGIGAALESKGDGLHINMVVPEGGAGVAGLTEGDVITAIDGVGTDGMSFGEAIELIRGEEDSSLKLTVITPGQAAREVDVQRLRFQL